MSKPVPVLPSTLGRAVRRAVRAELRARPRPVSRHSIAEAVLGNLGIPLLSPGPPTTPASVEATIDSGPLDPLRAAALGLVSRPTIYRLLKVHPAPVMLGDGKQSARWANRETFERWLVEASARRRQPQLETALAPRASAVRGRRRAAPASAPGEDPLDRVERELRDEQKGARARPGKVQ